MALERGGRGGSKAPRREQVFGVNYFCRSLLPHLRMLPAILRMIVPAVSDESRAGGTHGLEMPTKKGTPAAT